MRSSREKSHVQRKHLPGAGGGQREGQACHGMSLRPENQAVHITAGMEASNIDEKYYEPPPDAGDSFGLRRL